MQELNDPLGWQSVDPSPDANAEQFERAALEQFDLNAKIAKIFGGSAGKDVLEWLRSATIESAAWMPSIAMQRGIEAANAHAYAREGQNALVRDLERRIELAKKCKTPDDLARFVTQRSDL